ncbi:hypothetical protein SUDANB180_01689 [Streptomyces sp. enrichment culture]
MTLLRPKHAPAAAPAGPRAGRAAGPATVALATTHRAAALDADLVADDLPALSVLVTERGVTTSRHGGEAGPPCPPLSSIRTAATARDRPSGLLNA